MLCVHRREEGARLCVLDLPALTHIPGDVCHTTVSMTGTARIVQCTACATVCGDPGPGFFPEGK